jgi:LacI family transcriptional regulator
VAALPYRDRIKNASSRGVPRMAHRFPIKEIARQAGVGAATVDRVLNGRAHVREPMRQRVLNAIDELERQHFQLAARGRRLVLDMVMEAPRRFSEEVRGALEAVLPGLHPAVFRPRFLMRETMPVEELAEALRAIARRGSHGVLLKARDVPELREAIAELRRAGIPVVTVFTDIPRSERIAYAGLDNRVAGATAAYLVAAWPGPLRGAVLMAMSNERFRGEEERELAFRDALRVRRPGLALIDASGGQGLDAPTEQRVREAVGRRRRIAAVYSMGGGNTAILRALEALGQRPALFVGHDLDRENLQLLRAGRLTAVLHHDLRQDLRAACHQVLRFHRLLPADAVAPSSQVQVVTPENIPADVSALAAGY